jgi:fructoselysine-6-phosphate deglycase
MLNLDEDRFVRIQSGAVGLATEIDRVISDELGKGATSLFFMGAGGAGILMLPAFDLLRSTSTMDVRLELPAEVVRVGSPVLGAQSLVVIPSLSGTTPESLEALAYCQQRGATVITLTGDATSPLAQAADHNLTNEAADDTSSESFYLQSLLIALSVLKFRGELEDYDEVVAQLDLLPPLLLEVKRSFEVEAEKLAEQMSDETYHVVTGAGSTWPQAWYYGMCILEEMQWIRTRPVHASDFFHGTLELVEKDVSVVVLAGEDLSRPLVQRVLDFVPRYTENVKVLDSAAAELPGISARVRALVSPVVLATMLERLSAHLEVKRDHPLTTRRYYKRVAY